MPKPPKSHAIVLPVVLATLAMAAAPAFASARASHVEAKAHSNAAQSAVTAQSVRETAPDAFLRRDVRTKAQLIRELAADPGARTGYAKLFHIAPWAVVAFVRQYAHAVSMPATGKYTVWRVTNEGTVYPTVQMVSRGEDVFSLHGAPSGLPNLISGEGDPMKPFVTAVTVVVVRPAPVTRIITRVAPSQETIVPTQPQVAIVPVNLPVYAVSAAQGEGAGTSQGTGGGSQ